MSEEITRLEAASTIYRSLSYCLQESELGISKKIEELSQKIKNPQALAELKSAHIRLFKRFPGELGDNLLQQEETVSDFKSLINNMNDYVFKILFKVIINQLNISSTDIGGDSMKIYARNFRDFCEFKETYGVSSEIDNPAYWIFTGKWNNNRDSTENKLIYPITKTKKIMPRYFFIFDFITESRNLTHEDIGDLESSKQDLITGLVTPGNYFTFSSIYLLSLYAFDEVLDLMIKYL